MINFIKVNTIKEFEDVENYYYCDSFGNIYSNSRKGCMKPLKQRISNCGYVQVNLMLKNGKQKTYSAHRIIACAFIPNTDNKPTVNHINHDRLDNRVDNLEWATMTEQMDEVHNSGVAKARSKKVKLTDVNGAVLEFDSIGSVAEFLEISYTLMQYYIRKGVFDVYQVSFI